MRKHYSIGSAGSNDIVTGKETERLHAEIIYDKGNWMLRALHPAAIVYLNDTRISRPEILEKYDVIRIDKQRIFWQDYLYEGERQELHLRDLVSYHGRISRANFRTLSILFLGLAICVFFLPALVAAILTEDEIIPSDDLLHFTSEIASILYPICYALLLSLYSLICIKRMRDTRKPLVTLFIPFYNFSVLYWELSAE